MSDTLHASAFAYQGAGCLVLGPSGSGKSRLVAEALTMGAKLVADDQVILSPMMGFVGAAPHPNLQGVLEFRGLGLIRLADTLTKHVLHLAIELDPTADARAVEPEEREFLGVKLPYLRVQPVPHISATTLLLYLKAMQEKRVLPADWRPSST